MKERKTLIILALAALLAFPVECPAQTSGEITSRVVQVDGTEMVFHPDNHKRSRKNADKVFDAWADRMMLRRGMRSRRLESIAIRDDGAHLKYYFDAFSTGPQRDELVVPNTTVKNWKEKRK